MVRCITEQELALVASNTAKAAYLEGPETALKLAHLLWDFAEEQKTRLEEYLGRGNRRN